MAAAAAASASALVTAAAAGKPQLASSRRTCSGPLRIATQQL